MRNISTLLGTCSSTYADHWLAPVFDISVSSIFCGGSCGSTALIFILLQIVQSFILPVTWACHNVTYDNQLVDPVFGSDFTETNTFGTGLHNNDARVGGFIGNLYILLFLDEVDWSPRTIIHEVMHVSIRTFAFFIMTALIAYRLVK